MIKETATSRFPACCVRFPIPVDGRSAAFFLAAEEYVAKKLPADNYFFSWVLAPTVVMGRNQIAAAEVDIQFCQKEGIEIVRRKSGGGCIYADGGNIMFSLITTQGDVESIFAEYSTQVAAALTAIGAKAHVSGRNDVLLESGAKVCGNAFYHLSQRNIVHGTMLYDTDYRRMSGALTPIQQKLEGHRGVGSVRSRVGLIKDICPIGVEALRRGIETRLCDRTIEFTAADILEIEAIERPYHDSLYIYGHQEAVGSQSAVTITRRIEGCGTLTLSLKISAEGDVCRAALTGDFFSLTPSPEKKFARTLQGQSATSETLKQAVAANHLEHTLRGLDLPSLFSLIEAICN